MSTRYRTGRKLGRTLYLQLGEQPSEVDTFIGIFDDSGFAAFVADLLNECEMEWDHEQGHEAL